MIKLHGMSTCLKKSTNRSELSLSISHPKSMGFSLPVGHICFYANKSKQTEYDVNVIQRHVHTFHRIAKEQSLSSSLAAEWSWLGSWLPDLGGWTRCVLIILMLILAVGTVLFCCISCMGQIRLSCKGIKV